MGNVVTLKTLDASVISLIILVFIYINSRTRTDKQLLSQKLFTTIVILNIYLLIVDYLAWAFNGTTGETYIILNAGFNCLLYISAPAALMLWAFYIYYQVLTDKKRLKKLRQVLVLLFIVNAALSVASLFTGWYFSVDAQNIYHRGPLFALYVAYNYALILYSVFFVLQYRKAIEKKYFYSLLLFFVPPTVGTLLQTFIYGLSYNWVGMALSVLMVYFNIQNRSLNTDYLTGAYNRRQLDGYTKSKARSGENVFGAIMFDLDNLKQINDTYGHDAGDDALKDAVSVVRRSIRENDFIARTGGDEFVVILDVQDMRGLEAAKDRIEQGVAEFNKSSSRAYRLSFSYGYSIYDVKSGVQLDDFFKQIDTLMYKDKNEKKTRVELGGAL
jgi:diguanylate cyclase (GGDEF)-like protein